VRAPKGMWLRLAALKPGTSPIEIDSACAVPSPKMHGVHKSKVETIIMPHRKRSGPEYHMVATPSHRLSELRSLTVGQLLKVDCRARHSGPYSHTDTFNTNGVSKGRRITGAAHHFVTMHFGSPTCWISEVFCSEGLRSLPGAGVRRPDIPDNRCPLLSRRSLFLT
jgi:hypothetical protein